MHDATATVDEETASHRRRSLLRRLVALGFGVALLLGLPTVSMADDQPAQADRAMIAVPAMDATRGRALYVKKGCVLCHTINEVGGRLAPPLDTYRGAPIDLFEFTARMWRGAIPMLALQEWQLGFQIAFTGKELADIVAFLGSSAAQSDFTIDDVPEVMQRAFVDEPIAPYDGHEETADEPAE